MLFFVGGGLLLWRCILSIWKSFHRKKEKLFNSYDITILKVNVFLNNKMINKKTELSKNSTVNSW